MSAFNVERFWAEILSREAERIRAAYLELPNEDERDSVYDHLLEMAMEDGWTEPQRFSAVAALSALQPLRNDLPD